MKELKILLIPFFGIFLLASFTILFNKNSASAQVVPLIPLLCPNCQLSGSGDRLKGKDATNAFLPSTTFTFTEDLTGTIFTDANLDSVTMDGTILVGTKFKNASLKHAQLDNLNGTNTNFKNANLLNSNLNTSNFTGANFTNAILAHSDLSNSNFTNANFTSDNLDTTIFSTSNLQNTNFTNAIFNHANLQGATNMSTATISGATWTDTICPDGTNSDGNGNTCVGHF